MSFSPKQCLQFVCVLAGVCFLLAWTQRLNAASPPARLRALIFSTEQPPSEPKTQFLTSLLVESGRFDVRTNQEWTGSTKQTLSPYDVVVLNDEDLFHEEKFRRTLDGYVKSGKGLLVLGGDAVRRFTNPSGPPVRRPRSFFDVRFVDQHHPISSGMRDRFVAADDLVGNLRLEPGTRVLATAWDAPARGGSGKEEPILWTSSLGAGRIFFSTLGNDLAAMYGEGFAETFLRGAEWAATGKVTLPPQVNLFPPKPNPVRVLVVTGGHVYPTSFYSLFEGYQEIAWEHATSNLMALQSDLRPKVDVLVLYDWHRGDLPDKERQNLLDFLESGKGVLILHHGISDYNSWQWWSEKVLGAKYFFKPEGGTPASSYKHDQDLFLVPVTPHPITDGIGPFRLMDETYHGMWYSPDIKVLIKIVSPLKDVPVVWVGPYEKSRIVYVLPGHDERSFHHPVYRSLVHNAILWAAGRLK